MNNQELSVNVDILEHLGWFIAEDDTAEDKGQFDAVLLCCRPDGYIVERCPVSRFLNAWYDEQEGGLEAVLWFFAPKYATSLDNMRTLLCKYDPLYEWNVSQQYFTEDYLEYRGEVVKLSHDPDDECFESAWGTAYSKEDPALALAVAYLKCEGVYASDYSGESDNIGV